MEIFTSFQGEGKYAGQRTTFIRFGGCNLDCIWCDEPGSIPIRRPASEAVSAADILKLVDSTEAQHICITGGEPLIQNEEELYTLLSMLKINKHFISIETNGTKAPSIFSTLIDMWTISPKLSSSENDFPPLRSYIANISKIRTFEAEMQLKFVMGKREDFYDLKPYLSAFPYMPIVINSMWENDDWTPKYTMKELVKLLDESGVEYKQRKDFKLGVQLHKFWSMH